MATAKVTKKAQREFLKAKLSTNDSWAKRALLRIYEYQTAEEQNCGDTFQHNGVGFTGADGYILSAFANQLMQKGFLSPRQMVILKKKIGKYWKQILSISNEDQLNRQIMAA